MRGQSGETAVIAIILVLASGLVIGGAMQYFIVGAKNKINLDACRLNVRTAAIAAIAGKDVKLDNCFTKEVGALTYSGNPEQYEKEVSLQIGQQLSDCAYQFDPKNGIPYARDWFGDYFGKPTVCFICSTFSFPEDAPADMNFLLQDRLLAVLRTTKKTAQQSYLDTFRDALPFPGTVDRETYATLSKYDASQILLGAGLLGETATDATSNPTEKLVAISTKKDVKYAVVSLAMPATRLGSLGKTTETEDEEGGASVEKSQSMVFMMPVSGLAETCGATFLRYP